MKISKRIFSLLVSLLVITSSVGVATATETTETTEEFKHIDISSYLDSSTIGKAGDEAGDNWFGGLTEYDAHNEFGGLIQFGTSTDTLIFNEYKNEVDTGRKIETSFPKERKLTENKDSVLLKPNSANELKLNLDSRSTEKLYFVGHSNGSTLNLKIAYSDGTVQEENFTAIYSNQSWYNGIKGTHNYPNVISTGATSYNNLKKGEDGKLALVSENVTPGNGLTLYGIEMDKDKIPQSVTFSNAGTNAKRIIFIYAVTQDFFTENDMKALIEEVKAYGTGIAYTTAQIEKIELAKEYATELSISDSDFEAIYAIAMKQKDMADAIHLDISSYLNASTIGTFGEEADSSTWFAGDTSLQKYGYQKQYFNEGDYLIFDEYENNAATGNKLKAYIPESRRTAKALDSYWMSSADNAIELNLKGVKTRNINFVVQTLGNVDLNVVVEYSDGTNLTKKVAVGEYGQSSYHKHTGQSGYYKAMTGLKGLGYRFVGINQESQLYDHFGTNKTVGIAMYKVDIDEEKIPVSIKISHSNTNHKVGFYAVSQIPVTLSEMTTAIETAKDLKDVTRMFTSDEITAIENAKKYASTLVEVGVGTASDYAFLDTLFAKAQKQKAISGVTHFDISDKYNADTIASAGDTVGDSWFDGYAGFSSNFDGVVASAFNNNELFDATTYVKDNENMVKQNETVEVYIPNVGRKGGENDAVAVWGEKTLEVELHNVVTEKIYYVANNSETFKNTATIYYTDGTTETVDSNGTNCASTYYSNKNDKVAYLWLGGTFASKGTDNVITTSGNHTVGYIVYNVAVDKTKVVDKVVFKNTNTSKPVFYYSVSQVPVTYTEMTTALEKGLENGVLTSEDEAQAELLAKYKSILVDCGVCEATDYPEVEAYTKQANAQKTSYVDLKDYVNADLMVKAGDTYSDNDEAKLSRTTELFNSESIKSDILTVAASSTGLYADDASTIEVGRTYKLSGTYNGKGNDVVKVEKDSTNASTIILPETVGTVKGIGVILDCNHANNQPVYKDGNYTNVGTNTGRKVTVTVNYTDGTKEDKQVVLAKSTAYKMSQFYANAGSTNRMDYVVSDDGTSKIQLMSGGGMNSPFFYSSNVEFDTSKTVKSLTFNSNSNGDYNIIAISQFVQTNAEVMNIFENEDPEIYENTDITSENVDASIKWLSACIELYERGFYDIITEEDSQAFGNMLAYAKALKKGNVGFMAEISVSDDGNNKKATFTMSNMADKDQNYVLVIAAYVGNKLVGFNVSETSGTVTAGETNKTDSISMAKSTETGVTYKAFVWESLSSLKAIGTSN